MNEKQNCAKCEFMKKYDYGKRIYYCDHVDRIDDMGKLGEENLPGRNPEWCPVKEKGNPAALYVKKEWV